MVNRLHAGRTSFLHSVSGRIPVVVSLDGADETFRHPIAPVTRPSWKSWAMPSGSSRNASVAIFMPFRKTSTVIRSAWRSNRKLLMAASFWYRVMASWAD